MILLPLAFAMTVKAAPLDYQYTMPQQQALLIALYREFDPTVVPYLYQISIHESDTRQWQDDGAPVVSPTGDVGIMQINMKSWDSTAKALGLDYKNSLVDNVKMAKVVYEKQGLQAWTTLNEIID